MYANQRRKTNSINQIIYQQRYLINEPDLIGDIFTSFFSDLFTSSNPFAIDSCLNGMQTKITANMNLRLMIKFTELEV